MFNTRFGIEIECTGILRAVAAKEAAKLLGGTVTNEGGSYGTYSVTDSNGRKWKFVSDGSINCQKKVNGNIIGASRDYSVELVSPILTYREDIETLQELVRVLRKAGGFTNSTCGIHIHLDGTPHTPKSIRNFVNIIASKNDLLYKALAVGTERQRYCKKMDDYLVEKLNRAKPKTIEKIADIWYGEYGGDRGGRYHQSRYHLLNLHSFFQGNRTVELRAFNGTLHAGVVRSYIVLALALNHQALTQRCASARKNQTENEKFAMRTYLNRIGFIGKQFDNCREHLTANLSGNSAWRLGSREATPRRTTVKANELAMVGV